MMRTWNLLGLSALAALVLVRPALAGGQPTDGVIPKTDAFKKLQEQVQAMDQALRGMADTLNQEAKKISNAINGHDNRLKTLEANDVDTTLKLGDARLRIERLEKQVEKLRLDMEALQKRTSNIALYPPSDKISLDEVRAQLRQIEQILNRMQGTGRTAFSSPVVTTGRILMVNTYPDMHLLFIINQKAYRVEAGQTAAIDNMPAGTFTYEVISPIAGSAGRHSRVLTPGQTYTLTARP